MSIVMALSIASPLLASADDVRSTLLPVVQKHCAECHGGQKKKAGLDLHSLNTDAHLLAEPKLLNKLVEVIESAEMPPDTEPPLPEIQRASILGILRRLLDTSTADLPLPEDKARRLNRFQYNNAVKDIFGISRDIFALPEKLMTRHDGFLGSQKTPLPDTVSASCDSFRENTGFRGIDPFPKDLRSKPRFQPGERRTLEHVLCQPHRRVIPSGRDREAIGTRSQEGFSWSDEHPHRIALPSLHRRSS